MSSIDGGAFGAGKAGAPFDIAVYLRTPQVILRVISVVFAIVVFGCIIAEGWNGDHCQMNDDPNACGYGTGIGILALLICLAFLVLDAIFTNISSVQYRKYVVIADVLISGLWTFLWFVGFCYLTNSWRITPANADYRAHNGYGTNHIQASIAFSFFSIITWGALTFLAVRRYREGFQDTFESGYQDQNQSSPYSSFPGSDTGDPYQQPPFSGQKDTPDFQPPTY